MLSRIPDERVSAVLSRALQKSDLIDEEDTALIFYDLSYLKKRITDLVGLFPGSTLHAIAIKANPLAKILRIIRELDVGAESNL